MSRISSSHRFRSFWALLAAVAILAGCSEDDPVRPGNLPEVGYLAVSPDSLMSLWQTALTTMDSTMYDDVHHHGFRFQFSQQDRERFQLPTDRLTRGEAVRTAWDMFSGEGVTNWQGLDIPGVSGIVMPLFTQQTPWEFAVAGSTDPTASARFLLQMFVERGEGYPVMVATGLFDFVAQAADTVDAGGMTVPFYRLILMTEVDSGVKASEVDTWGGVHLTYLVNEAPSAALTVTDIGGSPLPLFQCDASGSQDPDSGLHPEGYRWRFDAAESWTGWAGESVVTIGYPDTGPRTISVEVRDRWGATDTASQQVDVPTPVLPFPSSPDILMANFRTVYETRYFEGYREILHPDFLTILQQATTEEFPDCGPTLDFLEELRIHQRMLSGQVMTDPYGYMVPAVRSINFNVLRALDAWNMSPPDDIVPNAEWAPFEVDIMLDRGQNFSYLRARGTIKFYVTGRDTIHQGTVKKYYQMAGQVDLTGFQKGVEEFSWGSIKALWR